MLLVIVLVLIALIFGVPALGYAFAPSYKSYFARKHVWLVGASSGIGECMARLLGEIDEGVTITLSARRVGHLEKIKAEIVAKNPKADIRVYGLDVTREKDVTQTAQDILRGVGPIDVLLYNSGISGPSTCETGELSAAVAREIFDANFFGLVYSFFAVLPSMKARGKGHVVAVSSLAANATMPPSGFYSASKASVNMFLKSLRQGEFARDITFTELQPGFVRTDMVKPLPATPFILEVQPACEEMLAAIAAKRRVYSFPFTLAFITRLSACLPAEIGERLARRSYRSALAKAAARQSH